MNRRMYLAVKMVAALHTRSQHCVSVTRQGRCCSNRAHFHDYDDPTVRWCTLHARRVAEERQQLPQFQQALDYARKPIKIQVTVTPDGWEVVAARGALGATATGTVGDDTTLAGLEHALQQRIVHDDVPPHVLFGARWARGEA